MMIPRFTRTLLFLSLLSLLVLPTGQATAQEVEAGEVTGVVVAGDAETCAEEAPPSLSHERCVGGAFREARLAVVATRGIEDLDGRDPRVAACASLDPDLTVPFATRENTLEGRGRIGPVHADLGDGVVVDADPGLVSTGPCRVRIEGAFHRVGTVAVGRLVLDVHVDTDPARQFRHIYCARFVASAVPTIVTPPPAGISVLVTAVVEGRECDGDEQEPVDTHGRTPADDVDPLHHDECNAPPDPSGVACLVGA